MTEGKASVMRGGVHHRQNGAIKRSTRTSGIRVVIPRPTKPPYPCKFVQREERGERGAEVD